MATAKTFTDGSSASLKPTTPTQKVRRFSNDGLNGLREEELAAAWSMSGFDSASLGHVEPVALWIIGPSAVGKSTLACDVAPEFGIPQLPPDVAAVAPLPRSPRDCETVVQLDAVIVDGAHFRETWAYFQHQTHSEAWAEAYPLLKGTINKAKTQLLHAARCQRKHLVIPHTCLDLKDCLATVEELKKRGYTNHVLAVTAPFKEVTNRGRQREKLDGKRYAPSEFHHSISAFGPMIAACNGQYQLVLLVEQKIEKVRKGSAVNPDPFFRTVLSSGNCGSEPTLPPEAFG